MSSTLAHALHMLKTTAHATYAAAYHQVIINSVVYIIVGLMIVIAEIFLSRYFLRAYKFRYSEYQTELKAKEEANRIGNFYPTPSVDYFDIGFIAALGGVLPLIAASILIVLGIVHLLDIQWSATTLILQYL